MNDWQRVSRHSPCEVCGKPDWCTRTDGGSCCMRVESATSMRNGGWWHPAGGSSWGRATSPKAREAGSTPARPPDFRKLIDRWRREKAGELEPYAATLGVGKQDLDDLHVAYAPEYDAFAFPMYEPNGTIVGIRLRNSSGHKWSVKGGHQGLFIPFAAIRRVPTLSTVMIVEGPTDTAAGLALGFFTIGRPNNLVGNEMIAEVLKELQIVKEVIVCYDNDEHIDSMGKLIRPGPFGAERLIKYLKCRVVRFVPPTKDLRSFLQSGGNSQLIYSLLGNTVRTYA
jgi:hypothetical protein